MFCDASFASPSELCALQKARWEKQSAYVNTKSNFYTGRPVPSRLDDLPSYGFTTKSQLRDSQNASFPFGRHLAADPQDVIRLHRTSGTTGTPVNIALSRNDATLFAEAGGMAHSAAGLRPGMLAAHCLNYRMWMGGFTDHTTLEATGATVVPFGIGGTDLLIKTALDLKLQALFCTVSYPSVLEQVLNNRFQGKNPRDLGLKLALLTGEPGLENREFRSRLEDTWGFATRNIYGVSDILTIFAGECHSSTDMHFTASSVLYPELINGNGDPVSIETGARGELVLTNLFRECQPLVRFRTSDVIEITDTEPCKCGRTSFRFRIQGRADDMLMIRGINVFPSAVGAVVSKFKELSGQYRIVLKGPAPYDRLPVSAELTSGTLPSDALAEEVASSIKAETGVTAIVSLLEPFALERTEGKTKLVIRE